MLVEVCLKPSQFLNIDWLRQIVYFLKLICFWQYSLVINSKAREMNSCSLKKTLLLVNYNSAALETIDCRFYESW